MKTSGASRFPLPITDCGYDYRTNYIKFSYFSPHKKNRKELTQSARRSKDIIVQKLLR